MRPPQLTKKPWSRGRGRTHNLLCTNWSRPRPPRSTETRRVLTGAASRPISSTCIHRTPWTGEPRPTAEGDPRLWGAADRELPQS